MPWKKASKLVGLFTFNMSNDFKNKTILVTGGTGSIGSALVAKILTLDPKQIRILSRDESKQYHLFENLNYPSNLRLLIGDIRDQSRLEQVMQGVDIVIHTAALKHVPLCEYNFSEAIATNVIGSQNVIASALKNHVPKTIAISTDKAVYPTNVMGASKLLMEKMFTNANFYANNFNSRFACVRFGNILFSNGSVLPLWQKQAAREQNIHITSPDMTRFFISKDQAADLVLKAVHLVRGGEIFISKMPSINIGRLARHFAAHLPYPVKIMKIGFRHGEKKHEAILDDHDLSRPILEDEAMFIILPNLNLKKHIIPAYQHLDPPPHPLVYRGFKPARPANLKKHCGSETCYHSKLITDLINYEYQNSSSPNR